MAKNSFVRIANDTWDFQGDALETLTPSKQQEIRQWIIRPSEPPLHWRMRVPDKIKNPKLDFGRMAVNQIIRIPNYPGSKGGALEDICYFRRVVVQYCTLRGLPLLWRLVSRQEHSEGARPEFIYSEWVVYLQRLPDSGVIIPPALLSLHPDESLFGPADPDIASELRAIDLKGYAPPPTVPLWEAYNAQN